MQLHHFSWRAEHEQAFTSITENLKDAVRLNHRQKEKELCVYTDASEKYWAAAITQRKGTPYSIYFEKWTTC